MRRFNLSQEQQQQLLLDMQETGQRILAVVFDNPANDDITIRHHAYLRGKWDQLRTIYEDNYPDPQPLET
jgi:hypothetical protein